MYNGIGLSTVRGSATNGYVQRNLSHVRMRKRAHRFDPDQMAMPKPKGANKELLQHERKREIEVKVLGIREALEDRGCVRRGGCAAAWRVVLRAARSRPHRAPAPQCGCRRR